MVATRLRAPARSVPRGSAARFVVRPLPLACVRSDPARTRDHGRRVRLRDGIRRTDRPSRRHHSLAGRCVCVVRLYTGRVAKLAAASGARPMLVARNEQALQAMAQELSSEGSGGRTCGRYRYANEKMQGFS
jgi:hypothetical protein